MSFRHIQQKWNPRLTASYCAVCNKCIAVSMNEELLKLSESDHDCPQQQPLKRGDHRVSGPGKAA